MERYLCRLFIFESYTVKSIFRSFSLTVQCGGRSSHMVSTSPSSGNLVLSFACRDPMARRLFLPQSNVASTSHAHGVSAGEECVHWTLPCKYRPRHQPSLHHRAHQAAVRWRYVRADCKGPSYFVGRFLLPIQLEHCSCRRLLPRSGDLQLLICSSACLLVRMQEHVVQHLVAWRPQWG